MCCDGACGQQPPAVATAHPDCSISLWDAALDTGVPSAATDEPEAAAASNACSCWEVRIGEKRAFQSWKPSAAELRVHLLCAVLCTDAPRTSEVHVLTP